MKNVNFYIKIKITTAMMRDISEQIVTYSINIMLRIRVMLLNFILHFTFTFLFLDMRQEAATSGRQCRADFSSTKIATYYLSRLAASQKLHARQETRRTES